MDLIHLESLKAAENEGSAYIETNTLEYMHFVQESVSRLKSGDTYRLSSNPSGILPDETWNQLSSQTQSFVLELIGIHETYSSLFQLDRRISTFVTDVENSSIILDEKIALYGGAYTALYSNIYWDEHADDWDLQVNKTTEIKFKSWRDHVKADIGGGIMGAFMGARAGAISGAVAGGVGAIPGAVAGGIGGGIAGACGASAVSIVLSWF